MTTTLTTALGSLLTPTNLAGLPLSSRFAMAPMTRFRSPGGVPTPEVAAYYRRRAEHGIGLIISEGVLVGHPSAQPRDHRAADDRRRGRARLAAGDRRGARHAAAGSPRSSGTSAARANRWTGSRPGPLRACPATATR
nr:hypothetical protein GCM10020092_070350 [Actinoplanes digitatis]